VGVLRPSLITGESRSCLSCSAARRVRPERIVPDGIPRAAARQPAFRAASAACLLRGRRDQPRPVVASNRVGCLAVLPAASCWLQASCAHFRKDVLAYIAPLASTACGTAGGNVQHNPQHTTTADDTHHPTATPNSGQSQAEIQAHEGPTPLPLRPHDWGKPYLETRVLPAVPFAPVARGRSAPEEVAPTKRLDHFLLLLPIQKDDEDPPWLP
jgi:hypothetical protein